MPNPLCLRQAISLENCLRLLNSSGAKDKNDFYALWLVQSNPPTPHPRKLKCQNEKLRTHPAKFFGFGTLSKFLVI